MLDKNNIGKQNELAIIRQLDGRKFNELNDFWKQNIKKMFPRIKPKNIIECHFYKKPYAKPDITIKVKKKIVYVSIKSGRNTSIHQEQVRTFTGFLNSIHVPDYAIKGIYFYHYGESQYFNKREKILTKEELEENYGNVLLRVNSMLQDPYYIKSVIDRCVIKGNVVDADPIDFLYYGNEGTGFLLSKEEIYERVLAQKEKDLKSIHFGGLIYQPDVRNPNSDRKIYMRIKWPILSIWYYDQNFK